MLKKTILKADKLTLTASIRKIVGKKVNKLRKEGIVPANIYGVDFKSTSVSLHAKEFIKIYRNARETGIVYTKLDGKEVPVLIKNVQRHPVTEVILHVDLRKIDLTKKIQTEVPVKTVGISEAVAQKAGVLLTQSESLLVEALPKDIPHQIEIDISTIKEIGQEIKVSNLPKSPLYEIKTPAQKVVLSVVAHKEESVTPETTPVAAPEVITEKVAEGEEVAVPAVEGKKEQIGPAAKPVEAKSTEAKKPESPTKPAQTKK